MQRFLTTVIILLAATTGCDRPSVIVEHDVEIVMRDKTVLRADLYRPADGKPTPVLIYRTPYGKHYAADEYQTHLRAVERGYAVLLQDVRGRYASDGSFDPYRNEGVDGYDTIEWAAKQEWSNGEVGTFGLSYPGAVQWLAAIQSPPHLKAMVPAMTYSSPRNFFYMNGVFDLSWLPWVYFNIAPDARVRLGMDGPRNDEEVSEQWKNEREEILSYLPLAELPFLRDEAPFYFEWLEHPPNDPWWDWAEISGRYDRTDAAVLNLSGWYDEAYGPEGATTNFNGLVAARDVGRSNTNLIIGPWQHGVDSVEQSSLGMLDFGPDSKVDYDEEVLGFFDRHLKNEPQKQPTEPAVRYFVMGSNEWRTADQWPPAQALSQNLCLARLDSQSVLGKCGKHASASTTFTSDPMNPVVDPYGSFEAHDFQVLAERDDVLIFETEPLEEAITIAGNSSARFFVSCDCRDFDLWVRLLDVYPDGRAINLMSPGADVQRMSLRGGGSERQLLTPGDVYEVEIDGLLTANQFAAGHRIRIQVSASFAPHLSRNLQTGQSEVSSSASAIANITVHHSDDYPSSLILSVIN